MYGTLRLHLFSRADVGVGVWVCGYDLESLQS